MTNPFHLLLMSLLSTSIFAQEKVIRKFYKDYKEVKDSSMANNYCDIILYKKKKTRGKHIQYKINRIKEEECECSNAIKKEKEGICIYYYENESIKAIVTFKENKWNGVIKSYYENGQLRREDEYNDGAFVSGKCYTSSGADTVHFPYYKIAEPVGGLAELYRHIVKNFKYPEEARRKKFKAKYSSVSQLIMTEAL